MEIKMTVPQIKAAIERLNGNIPKGAKKADLIRILMLLNRPRRIRDNYLYAPGKFGGLHTLTDRQKRRMRKATNRAKKFQQS